MLNTGRTEHISIHALREEGDIAIIVEVIFEPDFYPRPPRGGRRRARPTRLEVIYFYPRPPRGGRLLSTLLSMRIASFLSTPSARRATCFGSNHPNLLLISIHALREEGDPGCFSERKGDFNISIHALREEGDAGQQQRSRQDCTFLSTPSARRAT